MRATGAQRPQSPLAVRAGAGRAAVARRLQAARPSCPRGRSATGIGNRRAGCSQSRASAALREWRGAGAQRAPARDAARGPAVRASQRTRQRRCDCCRAPHRWRATDLQPGCRSPPARLVCCACALRPHPAATAQLEIRALAQFSTAGQMQAANQRGQQRAERRRRAIPWPGLPPDTALRHAQRRTRSRRIARRWTRSRRSGVGVAT